MACFSAFGKSPISRRFLVIICAITVLNVQRAYSQENPNLVFDKWPKDDWTFVNLSDGSTALFSEAKDTFIINCTASYPIQWNIKGTIYPPDFVKIQPYRRYINEDGSAKEFKLRLILFFTPNEYSYSSAVISCEKIGAPEIASKYSVFVPSDTTLLNNPSKLDITGTMIPCPTTDPTTAVSLFKVAENGDLEKVENVVYSELHGFKSETSLDGTFACVAKNKNGIEHRMDFTVQKYPLTKTKRAFIGEKLQVICPSVFGSETINYTTTGNDSSIMDKIQVENSKNEYKFNIPTSQAFQGSINCSGSETGQTHEIWNFEVLDQVPELYLNNYEREIDCLSEHPDRSVSTVWCSGPSDCEFMRRCLKHDNICNYRRQKQFYSSYAGRCWVQKKNNGASCAFLPFYHLNGLVQCGGGGGAVKEFQFFVGLDFRRYSNWQDAPKNALIKLEAHHEAGNNRTEFLCQAAAFLFADSLKFSILYENGTEIFLNETSYTNPEWEHPKKMDELNVLGHLVREEPFYKEVIGLRCHAPWWNSTEFMTTEMKLKKGRPLLGHCFV